MVKYEFWTNAAAGNDKLTIDFFDASHTLMDQRRSSQYRAMHGIRP